MLKVQTYAMFRFYLNGFGSFEYRPIFVRIYIHPIITGVKVFGFFFEPERYFQFLHFQLMIECVRLFIFSIIWSEAGIAGHHNLKH